MIQECKDIKILDNTYTFSYECNANMTGCMPYQPNNILDCVGVYWELEQTCRYPEYHTNYTLTTFECSSLAYPYGNDYFHLLGKESYVFFSKN